MIPVEDGIQFDLLSVKGSSIRKDAGYGGVRIDLRAELDRARITLQVDIGFGDVVTPAAVANSRMKDYFDLALLQRGKDRSAGTAQIH